MLQLESLTWFGEYWKVIVEKIFKKIGYKYEHIIIDNNSKDLTVDKVKNLIKINSSIKLIVNNKNYGQLASPVHGIKQSTGDATILINADFQDPPELIIEMFAKMDQGYEVVYARRNNRNGESWLKKFTAKVFYRILKSSLQSSHIGSRYKKSNSLFCPSQS